jgi:hypothetical protein
VAPLLQSCLQQHGRTLEPSVTGDLLTFSIVIRAIPDRICL